jgi:hypothetical protein
MKKTFFYLFLIFLLLSAFYTSCDSPSAPSTSKTAPPLKRANLEMRLAQEPIVVVVPNFCISNSVIISETNGVGGNITSGELAWMYQEKVYETNNYPGKRFQAFESWVISDFYCLKYYYDKIRITLKGRDDNGFDFNFQKEWPIYYK